MEKYVHATLSSCQPNQPQISSPVPPGACPPHQSTSEALVCSAGPKLGYQGLQQGDWDEHNSGTRPEFFCLIQLQARPGAAAGGHSVCITYQGQAYSYHRKGICR